VNITGAICLSLLTVASLAAAAATKPGPEQEWLAHFAFQPLEASAEGVCAPSGAELPRFSVKPAAVGRQMVRVSLPFAPGTFPAELGLAVRADGKEIAPDVRHLTYHPGKPRSVRRAILTFPFEFPDTSEREFRVMLRPAAPAEPASPKPAKEFSGQVGEFAIRVDSESVEISRDGKTLWQAEPIAPERTSRTAPNVEVVERGKHYLWMRLLAPDEKWPRIIEVRADSLGTVAVKAHLQRLEAGDAYAPELGWRIRGLKAKPLPKHEFGKGEAVSIDCGSLRVDFPDAALLRRGDVSADATQVTYVRCAPDENVPYQEAAWRTAAFAVSPADSAPLTPLLEPPHAVRVPAGLYDAVCGSAVESDLSTWPLLDEISRYHRDLIPKSAATGDDFGNVTGYPAGLFGMNRLNHCPAIFDEYYRSSDAHLRETALEWCSSFFDLSIWWGTGRQGEFGGTRYNNVQALGDQHKGDTSFMWRSNTAVHFCTKGYDSFLLAYEETGDPRMAVALKWQVDYAKRKVHTDQGECRNIGDAADFIRLYRYTGDGGYLDEAVRLFRELRTKLGEDNLFSQGGQPIEKDGPFIDDDDHGYGHPFAKPYIIGYALAGLPELARIRSQTVIPNAVRNLLLQPREKQIPRTARNDEDDVSDEPRLRDVVRAVADFLASSVDPAGGWRYPHPKSRGAIISQGIEHAAQIARAAAFLESRGEPIGKLLDAIETVLQARILTWEKTGQILGGLQGWEDAAGILKDSKTVYDLYKKPADRDPARDYTEGSIGLGGSSPEGIVYFWEVLDFYLEHRPADRLFNANPQLASMLQRIDRKRTAPPLLTKEGPGEVDYLRHGMADKLPTFNAAQIKRLDFPLAYDPARFPSFDRWRKSARAKLLQCYLTPPPRAEFRPVVIAREDRGTHEARKIVFNVSADCRIPAYLLVPKGQGPFPAILALHDHGAHFSIGKEKMVRPFEEKPEVLADAEQWAATNYGGRFVGDELAKRGYVVFAADALFWGDRGRKEGIDYEAQQELAANLFLMGMTWSGVITWDDIRSAEFLASQPEVDPDRIGAIGLSMGAHRTWSLCAATDRIKAGAAICWMATTESLAAPGNNQTRGQSAYSMIVPNLRSYLDYADVAAIACPKPMLFFNGREDGLFPVEGVNTAYARLRRVWDARGAGDKLVTKLWPVPHVFNVEMQEEAFGWLGRSLTPTRGKP